LQFIPTPNPRFPDQLCTYDPQTEILTLISYLGRISVAIRSWMKDGRRLTKTGAITTALWLPMLVKSKQHWTNYLSCRQNLCHRSWSRTLRLTELTQAYRQWSQQQTTQDTTVALLYASAYGNTATLAQAIARGITKAGVGVESINCGGAS